MTYYLQQIVKLTDFIQQIAGLTYSENKNHVAFHRNKYRTRITCPKCQNDSTRCGIKSKSFFSTASLTRHVLKSHTNTKISQNPPSITELFFCLEKIAVALENGVPINTIAEVREWKIEVA